MNDILLAIVVAVFGSTGLWTLINNLINAHIERKKAVQKNPMQDMVLGLGYDRIVHVCNKYIDQGWIDQNTLRDINKYLYQPYIELGGNGTAEMLFDKVKELPNKPEGGD